jgi:hypothetical protein
MFAKLLAGVAVFLGLAAFVAAGDEPREKGGEDEAKIKANLDKLPEADRKLALAQRFCAVEADSRLGSMGVPVKIMVKDQPVFLCCKGCQKDAQADPDKTLARVKELRAKYGDKK